MAVMPLWSVLVSCPNAELTDRKEPRELKSIRSTESVNIRFMNKTRQSVDILWLDFEGLPVKYRTLAPNLFVDINTYIDHPWIFEDSRTKDRFVVNGDYVFYPPSWTELFRKNFPKATEEVPPQSRIFVMITLPVYDLRERCLQVVRDNLNLTDFTDVTKALQLPKSVEDDLIIMLLKKDGVYLQ